MFSRGVWVPGATVEAARAAGGGAGDAAVCEEDGGRPAAATGAQTGGIRRDVSTRRCCAFLAFHAQHAAMAERLARAVTDHATPVGSGTVARTERIPVSSSAEAAVIAWMRHKTTAYDTMAIARVKGKRREVRRMLAARSKGLLEGYRAGRVMTPGVVRCSGRCVMSDGEMG